jgi:hypothetical protein
MWGNSTAYESGEIYFKAFCRANAADPATAFGVTGLLTKRSLRLSKMFGPTERSSVASSAVLILDQ